MYHSFVVSIISLFLRLTLQDVDVGVTDVAGTEEAIVEFVMSVSKDDTSGTSTEGIPFV